MPIPAGPLPTALVVRPNAGTVARPAAGSGAPGAGADPALARARRTAERKMVDTCVIRRKTGTGEGSDEFGNVTRATSDVYAGKCRLQQPTATAQEEDSGEASSLMIRFELQLPMSVVGVQADDEVEMTGSRHDPDLAGRLFVVRGLSHKTHAVMRRLQVEERTS